MQRQRDAKMTKTMMTLHLANPVSKHASGLVGCERGKALFSSISSAGRKRRQWGKYVCTGLPLAPLLSIRNTQASRCMGCTQGAQATDYKLAQIFNRRNFLFSPPSERGTRRTRCYVHTAPIKRRLETAVRVGLGRNWMRIGYER